jgi:uncharacterized protein YceK
LNRLLFLVFLVALLLTTVSCGNIFVRGAINPGAQSANGVVSIVQFTADNGGVSITIITLTGSAVDHTLNFCGDQRDLFPVDRQVRVNFKPGTPCASVLSVNLM